MNSSYKKLRTIQFLFPRAHSPTFRGTMAINTCVERAHAHLHPAYNGYTNRHEFWASCNWIASSAASSVASPIPLPRTVSLKRGKTLFQALIAGSRGVNPFGWATIDTCAVSGKHRSAIIGERRPRHRWPRSWGLVPSGTGGTGLIATFMAPRGRLMHGRWRRSKLSSFPSFPPHSSDLTNASESLAKMNASLNEIFLKKFDGLVKIVVYEI